MLPAAASDWTLLSSNSDEESCESRASVVGSRYRIVVAVAMVGLLGVAGYGLGVNFDNNRMGNNLSLAATQPVAAPPYLKGWPRTRWMACTSSSQMCPMKVLDSPPSGCDSSNLFGKFLLTGDGLSSPPIRQAFQTMLEAAAGKRGTGNSPDGRQVLVVLDAAYDAYEQRVQFLSAGEYCEVRQKELSSLGATAVVCVIVDPFVRERLAKLPSETRESSAFAKAMSKITDGMILEELYRSSAIFVEAGEPGILLRNFKRTLKLDSDTTDSSSGGEMSLHDVIRVMVPAETLFYVGVSSGSSIAGEFIIEMSPDEGDNSGLGLVPNCSFFPHTDDASAAGMMHGLAAAYRSEVMGLPDCQPIVNTKSRTGHLVHLCPHQVAMPTESQGS